MPQPGQIKFLPSKEIDWLKWNECVRHAPNSLIYGYSFYLATMAKNWDGLVFNDYEAVMPLTWNKKYRFDYLYQPAFAASLGIFGGNINEQLVNDFMNAIPKRFLLIEISLNHGNNFPSVINGYYPRSNYILDLSKPYEEVVKGYRENHKRNISRSIQFGGDINKELDVYDVIELNKEYLNRNGNTKEKDYSNFAKLFGIFKTLEKQEGLKGGFGAKVYGITGQQNKILASAVFLFANNRAYYILVGNHPDGKTVGASHALIDAFIKDHAGQNLILDFEGSDIRNLAFFYSGFGAKEEIYPAIRINRLPWYARLLKK